MQYCSVFYDLLLMLRSQFTSAYLLHILYSHFYVLGNEEMIFLNQFWGWWTSSITSIMGNQVSLQIFMWWIGGSQRIIDLLFEEKQICGSQKKLTGGEGNSSYSSLSGKPCDLCQTKLMLWRFSNPSWLDIWNFWLLVTLCSMPRGL